MRSDLIFGALTTIPNRYLLTKVASQAARKLHRPGLRIQDTTNEVLVRFSEKNPIAPQQAIPEPQVIQRSPQLSHSVTRGASQVAAIPPARLNSKPLFEATLA